MKYLAVALAFYLILIGTVMAQETETKTNKEDKIAKNALGIAAGSTSAYGISYRRYIKDFGIQLTFAPIKTEDSHSKKEQIHLGFTFIYNIVKNEKSNLYLYQSNYYYWFKETFYSNQYYQVREENKVAVRDYWNNGIGVGFEFLILKVVSLNLMGGYGAYQNFENIDITGEAGLYYKF